MEWFGVEFPLDWCCWIRMTAFTDITQYGGRHIVFQTMELLYNNKLIDQIVDKLFRHRRAQYSQYTLQNLLLTRNIQHATIRLLNPSYETLHASLFTHSLPNSSTHPTTCILFSHGYGSNRLESISILKNLPDGMAMCAFDFSGSGKSEGERVTYGVKEKEDIHCILVHLRTVGFQKFILWGRSMGATATLLYTLQHAPEDVVMQVADSPFYSFEMIAFEIARRSVKAPEFIVSFALQMAKKNCQQFKHNPFEIELSSIGGCKLPTLFVYCQEDNVISSQNTHLITSKFKGVYEKLAIQQNHNTIRSSLTIVKILSFVEKYLKKQNNKQAEVDHIYYSRDGQSRSQPRYHLATPTHQRHHSKDSSLRSSRKGIERVEGSKHNKRNDDYYGIWVASKFTQPELGSSPQSTLRKKVKPKRTHLSLSSSFRAKHGSQQGSHQSSVLRQETSVEPMVSPFEEGRRSTGGLKRGTVRSGGLRGGLHHSKYL